MKLKIAPHRLAHALMADMRAALRQMEAGDYDGAFRILEARCRAQQTAPPPCDGDLAQRRAALGIMKHAPEGLLRPDHAGALEVAAGVAAAAIAGAGWIETAENAIGAANTLGDFGVSLEWNYNLDDLAADIKTQTESYREAARPQAEGQDHANPTD